MSQVLLIKYQQVPVRLLFYAVELNYVVIMMIKQLNNVNFRLVLLPLFPILLGNEGDWGSISEQTIVCPWKWFRMNILFCVVIKIIYVSMRVCTYFLFCK